MILFQTPPIIYQQTAASSEVNEIIMQAAPLDSAADTTVAAGRGGLPRDD